MNTALKIWQNLALTLLVLLLFLVLTGYTGQRQESFRKYEFEIAGGYWDVPQVMLFDTETGEIWRYNNFKPSDAHWMRYAPPLAK